MLARPGRFLLVAILLLASFSCSKKPDPDEPELTLGYTPYDTSIADREDAFEALRDYLESRLQIPVTLTQTASYQPAIEAMRAGRIDILNFGPYAYLIAEQEANAEAFAARGFPNGDPHQYHCLILCPADRPWTTIEEALAKPDKLKVAFTNKASTSGYLIPSRFYQSRGLNPTEAFGSVEFSKSHMLSILKVANGDFDLASVSGNSLESLLESGKLDPKAVRVLWRSAGIPNGPVAFRSDLDPELKQAVKKAYYEAHLAPPKLWRRIKSQYPDLDFIYIPTSPDRFAPLRPFAPQIAN